MSPAPVAAQFTALRPPAVNPGSIVPAPMVQTAPQPASVMLSETATQRSRMAMGPFTWSQIPGAASQGAYAADGSLWVLSNGPSGPDKYIWHYVSGNWTNIPGLARRIAAAPDGSLYAINSVGGVFHYASGGWTALGGGSSDVTVDVNSAVYVISNGSAADNAIWKFANGSWTQLAGAGARLASAPDSSLYVITSQGAIYNTSLTSTSWTQCVGAATRIVPLASGAGFIALGSPLDSTNGSPIFSFTPNTAGNCSSGSYAALNGSGVDVSGYGSYLAVLAPTGAIFSTNGVSSNTSVLSTQTLKGSAGYVNASGRTVYALSADTFNNSNCTSASGCVGLWPIVTPPSGVTISSPWSSFTRSDGIVQLAYNGNPLYTYAGDNASGQTNGDGLSSFGGVWTIARPNMAAARTQSATPTPAPSTAPTPCPGGYCY